MGNSSVFWLHRARSSGRPRGAGRTTASSLAKSAMVLHAPYSKCAAVGEEMLTHVTVMTYTCPASQYCTQQKRERRPHRLLLRENGLDECSNVDLLRIALLCILRTTAGLVLLFRPAHCYQECRSVRIDCTTHAHNPQRTPHARALYIQYRLIKYIFYYAQATPISTTLAPPPVVCCWSGASLQHPCVDHLRKAVS